MKFLENDLTEIRQKGLLRSLRSVRLPQGPEIELDGRRVLNFCSNNYLGLAEDSRLIEAGKEALERFGAGSGAARLISGNFSLHEELESGLARFKGTEAALLFNSGYHANIGVIPLLAGEGDLIFSDELNHASLIDGCRLSKAETVVYRHNDLNHLEELLRRGAVPAPGRGNPAPTKKMIITEAVFSMEGDLCPLSELVSLAERYGAIVYLDEAHAVGVFGDHGEGLAPKGDSPACRGRWPVLAARGGGRGHLLISMGTLGKAFGSYGAFICGSQVLKNFLINKARSFIFTTALPPSVIGISLAALKIVQSEPERREKLWENVKRVGASANNSWRTPLQSPIASIKIGDARKTMEISLRFLEEGIYIQGIRPPSVPEGTSRLRLTVMATHTEEHLKRLSQCLKEI